MTSFGVGLVRTSPAPTAR